jgi:molybdopterin converting factor small subunit
MNKSLARVTVTIAGSLRRSSSNAASVTVRASSVKQALAAVVDADTELGSRLFSPEGGIRRTVGVFVRAQDIRLADGLDTPLRDGDEIVLVSAIAGG